MWSFVIFLKKCTETSYITLDLMFVNTTAQGTSTWTAHFSFSHFNVEIFKKKNTQ